jgi:hypothetical protein
LANSSEASQKPYKDVIDDSAEGGEFKKKIQVFRPRLGVAGRIHSQKTW